MVNCEQCGWNNPEYAAFCTNCGTALAKGQPSGSGDENWRFREPASQPPDAIAGSGSDNDDAQHESASSVNEIDGGGAKRSEPAGRRLPESLLPSERSQKESLTDSESASTGEMAEASDEQGIQADGGLAQGKLAVEEGRRVGIRPAATLVDLTVPDFRAMVGRDDHEQQEQQPAVKSVSPGKVTIGLADTDTNFEAVTPDNPNQTASEPIEDTPELLGSEPSEAQSVHPIDRLNMPANAGLKDLGSLDVSIESVDGNLNVVDVYHHIQSADESADSLLSSIDMTPILEEESGFDMEVKPQPQVAAPPPPMPPSASLALEQVSSAETKPIVVGNEPMMIGREGDIRVSNDDFMSPIRAQVGQDDAGLWIEDASSLNGVWIRARNGCRLNNGTNMMMGQQIFRFEQSVRDGREPSIDKQGTRRMGSPRSLSGYRLVQLGIDGIPIAQFEIPRDGCKIGRSLADFVVGDDDHLSITHAVILPVGESAFEVRDLSTGNGCWLKLDGRRTLTRGDVVLTGRSVWQVRHSSSD